MATQRRRIGAALITLLIHLAIAWLALVTGYRVIHYDDTEPLVVLGLTPPPPIVQLAPHPVPSRKREGAASPPNLRSTASEIVAPKPVVPPLIRTPVVAAPEAGQGVDASQGAAEVAAPGTGSGGTGSGTGSGGAGDGDGDGGDDIPPRQVGGRLRASDLPQELADQGIGGTVEVIFTVEVDGHVTDCRATRSSGSRLLDDTTCRLIEARFRYRPSLDAHGRPVQSELVERHSWTVPRNP